LGTGDRTRGASTTGDTGYFGPAWSTDMTHLFRRLVHEESGQDIIEYALIATGIAILMIPTVPQLGAALQGVYQRIQTQVTSIGTAP
jgi:Flp pilus assembly pilin Flp